MRAGRGGKGETLWAITTPSASGVLRDQNSAGWKDMMEGGWEGGKAGRKRKQCVNVASRAWPMGAGWLFFLPLFALPFLFIFSAPSLRRSGMLE